MNESEQVAKGTVTPPPFCADNEPVAEHQATPSRDEQIAALNLDEAATTRLTELTSGLGDDSLTHDLLVTLARGITHDNDVQNADAAGYLRGRNEKIEAVMHPDPDDDCSGERDTTPVFPRYCRRSIWD